MIKNLKNKLYLMAAIIFLLLSVDFVSVYLVLERNNEVCCDCPDFVKGTLHSHTQIFQDEALDREPYSYQQRPEVFDGFFLFLNPVFIDSYCSKVWQPPKIY